MNLEKSKTILLVILILSNSFFITWINKLNYKVTSYEEIEALLTEGPQENVFYHEKYLHYKKKNNPILSNFSLLIAGQKGYATSQCTIGLAHKREAYNINVEECFSETHKAQAERWLLAAAKQGDANHQYELALFYDDMMMPPNKLDQKRKNAFYWYGKSAKQNHPNATFNLAQYYRLGYGCEIDLEKAEILYKKAGSLGRDIRCALADIYLKTNRIELAIPLLQSEAQEGDPIAKRKLETIYKTNNKNK